MQPRIILDTLSPELPRRTTEIGIGELELELRSELAEDPPYCIEVFFPWEAISAFNLWVVRGSAFSGGRAEQRRVWRMSTDDESMTTALA